MAVCPYGTCCSLERVRGRGGGEGASGRGVPDQDARFRLSQPPPLGLLAPMIVTTQRNMVAYADIAVELAKRLMIGFMS